MGAQLRKSVALCARLYGSASHQTGSGSRQTEISAYRTRRGIPAYDPVKETSVKIRSAQLSGLPSEYPMGYRNAYINCSTVSPSTVMVHSVEAPECANARQTR